MDFLLIPAVGQHRHHAIMISLGDEHVDVQVTLSLISLLRQYVARMRMSPFDFSSRRQAHSLGRTFVGLKFGHKLFLPFDCRFPIADCQLIPIGNWQSEIGNQSTEWAAPPPSRRRPCVSLV